MMDFDEVLCVLRVASEKVDDDHLNDLYANDDCDARGNVPRHSYNIVKESLKLRSDSSH
jgi:hypothetical protein